LSKREKARLAKAAAARSNGDTFDTDENSSRYNKEAALFRSKWKQILEEGDPYYNINFSLDRSDYSLKLHKKKKQG
jgi:hypothetical protein